MTAPPCRSGGGRQQSRRELALCSLRIPKRCKFGYSSGRSRPEPLAHSLRRRVGAGDGGSGAENLLQLLVVMDLCDFRHELAASRREAGFQDSRIPALTLSPAPC